MILQRLILYPKTDEIDSLLYTSNGNIEKAENQMLLKKDSQLDLSTFFNLFSAEKWYKFTNVKSFYVQLKMQGAIDMSIMHYEYDHGCLHRKEIYREKFIKDTESTINSREIDIPQTGMIGVVLRTDQGAVLYAGSFSSSQEMCVNNVNIGIGICTFKREEYVQRNIKLLREGILEDKEALAYGHVMVCISDNAGTLNKEKIETEKISVVRNKNLGGVGGFTRTILEHKKSKVPVTHILLMDDDAVIEPEAIDRMYRILTLLKEEYKDYIFGGALLREDQPTVLYENGARWSSGDIEAIHHDYCLNKLDQILDNNHEDKVEYSGWWYSCIPTVFIDNKKLPLPFFIHRDDVEYGLRANGKFIYWNGVCVWHAAFENKLPGTMEYYDMRNLAITNAIHDSSYSAREYKKMLFIQVSSNIGKYRYQYVDLNLRGALDFLKGFQWFYNLDTFEYHKELSKYNYEVISGKALQEYDDLGKKEISFENIEDEALISRSKKMWRMLTMNGHFFPYKNSIKIVRPNPNIYELYRCKKVVYIEATGNAIVVQRSIKKLIQSYVKLFKVFRYIDKHYENAKDEYAQNYDKIISESFWNEYLEL